MNKEHIRNTNFRIAQEDHPTSDFIAKINYVLIIVIKEEHVLMVNVFVTMALVELHVNINYV